jgi:hypothetical protein
VGSRCRPIGRRDHQPGNVRRNRARGAPETHPVTAEPRLNPAARRDTRLPGGAGRRSVAGRKILALVAEPVSGEALNQAVGHGAAENAELLVVAQALNTRTRFWLRTSTLCRPFPQKRSSSSRTPAASGTGPRRASSTGRERFDPDVQHMLIER